MKLLKAIQIAFHIWFFIEEALGFISSSSSSSSVIGYTFPCPRRAPRSSSPLCSSLASSRSNSLCKVSSEAITLPTALVPTVSSRKYSCSLLHRQQEQDIIPSSNTDITPQSTTSTKVTSNNNNSTITATISSSAPRWIHIGNIDWNVSGEEVQNYLESNLFHNLSIRSFHLKPKSNKPRDASKSHGGSVKIEFRTHGDAQLAMDRLMFQPCHDNDGQEEQMLYDCKIGHLRFRWMDPPPPSLTPHMDNAANVTAPNGMEAKPVQQHRKERAEKYARQRFKRGLETDALLKVVAPLWGLTRSAVVDVLDAPELDWDSVPSVIDPVRGGGLRQGSLRATRKQAQVEAILYVLRTLFEDYHDEQAQHQEVNDNDAVGKRSSRSRSRSRSRLVIADLASGAGNLSLPLAWFLRDIHATVLAVDINSRALERLSKRAEGTGVEVRTLVQDLEALTMCDGDQEELADSWLNHDCQAVVSLHACGAASDLAIEAAVSRGLPFVVSPCCIAKANEVRQTVIHSSGRNDGSGDFTTPRLISSQRSGAPMRISYPRSKELQMFCLEHSILDDYSCIMTAADYSIGDNSRQQRNLFHEQRGKLSKRVVEMDRLKWAEERGYYTRIMDIPRLGIYPKKELLLGAKAGSTAAERLSCLPTCRT